MTRTGIQEATLDKIKQLNAWDPNRKFTFIELKSVLGFTGNTLRALVDKGIVAKVKDAPSEYPEYYIWTGEEIE